MAICSYQSSSTSWRSTSVSPDECDEDYVIVTVAEYREWQTLKDGALQSPFVLDLESASQIGGAILLVWGVAFVTRLLLRALSIDEGKETQS